MFRANLGQILSASNAGSVGQTLISDSLQADIKKSEVLEKSTNLEQHQVPFTEVSVESVF